MLPIIEFKNISKRFSGTLANDSVSCKVYPGTVHAFLGENGAGKSTLMKILSGCLRADSGEILISEKSHTFSNPREAQQLGIGMVHQNYSLIPSLTLSENISLGLRNGFFHNPVPLRKRIFEFVDKTELAVKPDAYIWELSQGEKQRAEIFKLLFLGAKIIVLDEPTSSLTPQESDMVLSQMGRLARENHTVLFVTHKLSEVMKYSDNITILRNGRVVKTFETSSVSESALASLMVGNEKENNNVPKSWQFGNNVLSVSNIALENEHKSVVLSDITFDIKSGEILGIAGVAGNGQAELVKVLLGNEKKYRGEVEISLSKIKDARISYIPDDRLNVGTAPSLSIEENLMLKDFHASPFCTGIWINKDELKKEARERIKKFRIKVDNPLDNIWTLSGGNIQKVILARELASHPNLIIAVNPTRGLDIVSSANVHNALIKQAASGAAIVILSENLDELQELSHRIMVLFKGRSMGIFDAKNVTKQTLGLCMGGQRDACMSAYN